MKLKREAKPTSTAGFPEAVLSTTTPAVKGR